MQEFPIVSKLDPNVYGPPKSAITKELIEREIKGVVTFEEVNFIYIYIHKNIYGYILLWYIYFYICAWRNAIVREKSCRKVIEVPLAPIILLHLMANF